MPAVQSATKAVGQAVSGYPTALEGWRFPEVTLTPLQKDRGLAQALALRDALRAAREPQGLIDLRPLWRGRALEASAGLPMAVRRARALEAVLDGMALCLCPEECLAGSLAGVLAPALPAEWSPEAADRWRTVDRENGERTFLTGFDHCAVDYAGLLRVGLGGLVAQVDRSLATHAGAREQGFLQGVRIALGAAQRFALRWAAECEQAADAAPGAGLRLRMAADLRHVSGEPPETFQQAVQLVWLIHLIFALEGRGAMAFGRLDQYLWPTYARAVARGEQGAARDTLRCLWAKLEEPLIRNPVQNIAIGGVRPDGADATNALSLLILDVTREMGTPNSNLSARIHAGTPQRFLEACCEVIKTGIGFPALFNDEVLVPAVTDLGVPLEVARDLAFVGCIETFLPGRMPPWSDSRVNLLMAVDRALRDGVDGLTGQRRGPATGSAAELATFDTFLAAYRRQLAYMVAQHCEAIGARQAGVPAQDYPSPFLSAFIGDCIARGRDVNDGGAEYGAWHGPAGMGLASAADALAAIRMLVYDREAITLEQLVAALDADFAGQEPLRQRLLHQAPKYGNDDPYVDALAATVAQAFCAEVLARRLPCGGRFVPLLAANVANIAAGKEVGATPDGRRAGEPVSDAASPTFGRDERGPTAVISSLTQVDYRPVVGGSVVNVKFAPGTLAGPEGTALLRWLVTTYFARGGMQLQCNVTGRETLEAARLAPQEYRDLVVRVSGFSALYVTLSDAVQRDILARTEH